MATDPSDVARAQLPPHGAINVDHVAHFVPDIDAASSNLERLGFTLTPFSVQSQRASPAEPLAPAGTGNRCVMLERGYLELLTPIGDTDIASQLRSAIARYVGVHLIAFGTTEPGFVHARLAEAGFAPLPPIDLQRDIATEHGPHNARFTVVRVPAGTMQEGRIQYCQHHTPDLLWQPRFMAHGNRARTLDAVLIAVAEPQETARRYSRFSGIPACESARDWMLETSRGSLTFASPGAVQRAFGVAAPTLPWIAGYALGTDDLNGTRARLARSDCEWAELPGERIVVRMPSTLGGIVVFQQSSRGLNV